ncbi:MAG: hypothetical protein V4484_19590 [Pseudomonadota bacterium]
MNIDKFSTASREKLGHYVYGLVDPRDGAIFYVGKASGNNRAFSHLRVDDGETRKCDRIRAIRAAHLEPKVDILRYGLNKETVFVVEAAIIDTIGLEHLTNIVRGHGITYGRQSAQEVERLFGSKAKAVEDISDPCMLFFINKTYSPTKSESDLYDCVRQFWWGVGQEKRNEREDDGGLKYRTALAIVDSVVVRVYSIAAWFPAGSTLSSREWRGDKKCWEFVGKPLSEHKLAGKRLTRGGSDLVANQQGYGYL